MSVEQFGRIDSEVHGGAREIVGGDSVPCFVWAQYADRGSRIAPMPGAAFGQEEAAQPCSVSVNLANNQ
jgi:hypothetical protein